MVDFIATRVVYRDRFAALALAGDIRCAGTGLTRSGIADTGKRTHLGMALMPTGAS
jgi:hypothetical protein